MYYIVLVVVILLVFEQLGFDLSLVTFNAMLIFTALLVVCGVGFMIAARSTLENMLSCYQLQKTLYQGDRISIESVEGVVDSFTPTSVVVSTGQGSTVVPASSFLKSSYSVSKHGH